ncbi:hypothetical protein J0H58_17150 [bacterium]|nr:hypothetical protein [bacterium]
MHAVRTASGHPVCRVAFSPCGNWFATAQPNHGVTVYDRAGAAVRTVGSPRWTDYTGLTFCHGGAWIAAAGLKGIAVYDAATGACLGSTHYQSMRGFRLGSTGDVLLGVGRGAILELLVHPGEPMIGRTVWSVTAGESGEVSHEGRWAVAFRPTGRPIVVDLLSGQESHVLDHPARNRPNVPGQHAAPVVGFATAPRAALAAGTSVAVFDLTPAVDRPVASDELPAPRPVEKACFTLPPPNCWPAGKPWCPPFSLTPDGRGLLVKRPRERVQLWDVDAGTLDVEWSWRLDGITCLAVAPDGLTAVAGARHGRLVMWDLA